MERRKINLSNLRLNRGQIEGVPKNPRFIKDERFEKLKTSIQDDPEMLELREILVYPLDDAFVVIGGNMRLRAMRELGFSEAWCKVIPEDTTPDHIRAIVMKDNESYGNTDWEMVANEWDEVELEQWGIEIPLFELEQNEDTEIIEDEVPEPPVEPKAKLGDIYQLGEHRLMCGDATKKEDVEKLMDGEKADMVFTDPPYRMEVEGGSNQMVGKAAAKLGERIKDLCDFDPQLFLETIPTAFEKNKMNSYIFCNKDLVPDYLNWAISMGYNFNILFWKKPSAIPLGGQHRPDVEYLLFFRKGALWNNGLQGVTYSKCLEFGRENSTPHPTMKPVEMIANAIKISSNRDCIVFDPFGGSGSTLIACEQTNRKCYMMELDPKYIDVIIDRWEKFTGEKARLL